MTQPKTEQLNVRLPEALLQGLEEIATTEHLDRTAVLRKLLAEGIARYRLDRALRLYAEGHISKTRAAELAGVSLYDILDEIERRRLRAPYSVAELHEDLEMIQQRHGLRTSALTSGK
jgi:predicted HTH domain antitoxin